MHYYPSTFEEVQHALIKERYRRMRAGERDPRIVCTLGRIHWLEIYRSPALQFHDIRDFAKTGNMQLCGAMIHFDHGTPWRFEFS